MKKENQNNLTVNKMNEKIKEALEDYSIAANRVAQLWCRKHNFEFSNENWVADDAGGVLFASDFFVDMASIIDDLKYDAPEEEFEKWYDYCIDIREKGYYTPTFRHWIKGCPRLSDDELKALKQDNEN